MNLLQFTFLLFVLSLINFTVSAADRISKDDIKFVLAKTDTASQQRDANGIEKYLGKDFAKYIELPMEKWDSAFRLNRDKYISLIKEGWKYSNTYGYERTDTVIHVATDGLSADSNSTITEIIEIDGKKMISKVREYAHYELEDGRAVITTIEGHKLVGDTTPEPILFSKKQAKNDR
jgi:hypothetical protein